MYDSTVLSHGIRQLVKHFYIFDSHSNLIHLQEIECVSFLEDETVKREINVIISTPSE